MKTISWILLFSMINFIGCSATKTYWILHDQSYYNQLNEKLKKKKGKMVLKNGDVIKKEKINIGLDSTSWMEKRDSLLWAPLFEAPGRPPIRRSPIIKKTIATSEIEKITFTNHGNGFRPGFGYGFLVGAAAGAVLGDAWAKALDSDLSLTQIAIFMGVFGLGGGLLGGITGAIIGGTDEYIFTEMPPDSTFDKEKKK